MKTISLRGMDRDDLHQLMYMAQQIQRAMAELEEFSDLVTVSMVPGEPVQIQCHSRIAGLVYPWEEPGTAGGEVAPVEVVFPAGIEPETPEIETPAAPEVPPGEEAGTPGGGEASAAAGEYPETGTPAAAATAAGAEPVDPGGVGYSAAGAPLTPDDPAEAEAHGGRPPRWTEVETETALAIVVQAVLAGGTAASAAAAVAEATGRPFLSVQLRIKSNWRDDIAARVAAVRDAAKSRAPTAAPVTETTTKAAPEGEITVDLLGAHLARHIGAGGWTLAQDVELFRLAEVGWPSQEIALELRKPAGDVTGRFDLLTDKRFAKHRRADVLARLEAMLAEAA